MRLRKVRQFVDITPLSEQEIETKNEDPKDFSPKSHESSDLLIFKIKHCI